MQKKKKQFRDAERYDLVKRQLVDHFRFQLKAQKEDEFKRLDDSEEILVDSAEK